MSQSVLSGDSRVGINNQHLLEKVNGYRGVCQYLFPAILFIFRKGAYHRNQYLWGRQSISLEALVTAKISQSSQSRCQISGEGNLGLVSQVHLRSYW